MCVCVCVCVCVGVLVCEWVGTSQRTSMCSPVVAVPQTARVPPLFKPTAQIALMLWDTVVGSGALDFGDGRGPSRAATLQAAQCRAVTEIRRCLDITTFQRSADGWLTADGQHERDRRR